MTPPRPPRYTRLDEPAIGVLVRERVAPELGWWNPSLIEKLADGHAPVIPPPRRPPSFRPSVGHNELAHLLAHEFDATSVIPLREPKSSDIQA
jgi:hypothetical protein